MEPTKSREDKIKARADRLNTLVDQRYERNNLRGPNKEIRREKWEVVRNIHNGQASVLRYIFDAYATSHPMGDAYGSFLVPADLLNMSIAFHMHVDGLDPMRSEDDRNKSLHNEHITQKAIHLMNEFQAKSTTTVKPALDATEETKETEKIPIVTSTTAHLGWESFQHWCRTAHNTIDTTNEVIDGDAITEDEVILFLRQLVALIARLNGELVSKSLLEEYNQFDTDNSMTMNQSELLIWMDTVRFKNRKVEISVF